ncbi:hypothetical protein MPSEU_000534000 [Mayamaea pseudoterrestris]|nr:hypothetical protein MPSEU_000534000 [Mayamaea pseudoterrestris]
MHVLPYLIMANDNDKVVESEQEEDSTENAEETDNGDESSTSQKHLQNYLESRAVDRAKATVDNNFKPSASVLNAPSATLLLQQVDGPSLQTYQGKESIYVGRSVPIAAGGRHDVPIHVTTPGSVVEYAVELPAYDIGFCIMAERDEGSTVVKEHSNIDYTHCPVTQKFLVGTVPCTIKFEFDNAYSWMRSKQVSYKITVTPPSKESLAAGRRRRAQACLKAVQDDLQTATTRLLAANQQKQSLQQEVASLMALLQEKKKAWMTAEKEEAWLKERKELRTEQQKLLKERLTNGWDDEEGLKLNL